jgi:hypothetical protein
MAKPCKTCGALVDWKREAGKWQCHNAGTTVDHWDACSKNKFDRIKKTGEYFENGTTKGYITDLKPSGVQYTQQSARVVGDRYKPSGDCADCCPPWEVCSFPCPDAI